MADIDQNADESNKHSSTKQDQSDAQRAKETQEFNAQIPTESSNSTGSGSSGTARDEADLADSDSSGEI